MENKQLTTSKITAATAANEADNKHMIRHSRVRRWREWSGHSHTLLIVLVCAICVLTSIISCRSKPPVTDFGTPLEQLQGEPTVRIRIGNAVEEAVIGSEDLYIIEAADDTLSAPEVWTSQPRKGPFTFAIGEDGLQAECTGHETLKWFSPNVVVTISPATPSGKTVVNFNKKNYFGIIKLHRNTGNQKKLDIINHVALDLYLPGVLAKELYPHWHQSAFEAQAIAARSYAIYHLKGDKRHYDMEATQASQAYVGQTKKVKPWRAVENTRGVVLAYNNQLVPAFYSSCSGGVSQSASVAFGGEPSIPPLSAKDHGSWGAGSPSYRWPTITRDISNLSQRMASWGKSRGKPIGNLTLIKQIKVSRKNEFGRPTQFTVTDKSGAKYKLDPEFFRFACNYNGSSLTPGTPKLKTEQKLKSAFVDVRVDAAKVNFVNGRGYGHGVGMCQWGAQAMASKGYLAKSIVEYYYPKVEVVKIY